MTDDQFSRIELLVGPAGLAKLRAAHVAVVGLGAVGSYATEALARAGVGRLRLVDFDEVRPSNINRQLYALHSTLGQRKVEVAAARVRDINPACRVEPMACFVHVDTMDQVLEGPPDLVIDAIDSFTPKVELLTAVRKRGIPVISSMGAALRTDPLLIRIGPVAKTRHCPLAKLVRKRLRRRGVDLDFPCVYSVEQRSPAANASIDREAAGSEDVVKRGRKRRPMGSLPTLTAIFGLVAANWAIGLISGRFQSPWCAKAHPTSPDDSL